MYNRQGNKRKNTLRLPQELLDQVNALGSGADNHYNLQLSGTRARRNTGPSRKERRKAERVQRKAIDSHHYSSDESSNQSKQIAAKNGKKKNKKKKQQQQVADSNHNNGEETHSGRHHDAEATIQQQLPKSILKRTKSRQLQNESNSSDSTSGIVLHPSKEAIAAEDAEIARLEKKLKIKSKKLPQSFTDDGLDFLLEGLEDNYPDSSLASRSKKRKRSDDEEGRDKNPNRSLGERAEAKTKGVPDESMVSSEDDNGEEEGYSDLGSDLGLDINPEDEEDDSDDDYDDKGVGEDYTLDEEGDYHDASDKESDANESAEYAEFHGFDAELGEGKGEKDKPENKLQENASSQKTPEPAKPIRRYIPPSLRDKPSTDGKTFSILRRKVQGQLNRLSEANVLQILSAIEELYREFPRHHVTSTLTDVITASINDRATLLDTFMILHAGFIAAVYKVTGTDFGAHTVQTIVEQFELHYGQFNLAKLSQEEVMGGKGKEAVNLMALLTQLYNFGVVGSSLVFDYIRTFVAEVTELNTELLLRIVRNSGYQLRQDDPSALKSVVVMLQPALAKAVNQSTRTKFMVETLNNLKNNRLKSATSTSEVNSRAAVQMKKQLGLLNSRHLRATEPLRPTLKDIKEIETKGKWWLVGASWKNDLDDAKTDTRDKVDHEESYQGDDMELDGDFATPDLLQLAREQRMNTEVRRAIFVAIMSSTDYKDAAIRLQKLRLKRAQEREIPRVLVHCCGSEENYNHFYTLVASELCSSHSIKMAFQFCLWEVFRGFGEQDERSGDAALSEEEGNDESDEFDDDSEIDEDEADGRQAKSTGSSKSLKKILNLARLYGSLIVNGALSITVLKILNIYTLQSSTKDFLEILFVTIFQGCHRDGKVHRKVDQGKIRRIFGIKGMPELARSIEYFLTRHVKLTDLTGTSRESKISKKACTQAQNVLKAVAVAE